MTTIKRLRLDLDSYFDLDQVPSKNDLWIYLKNMMHLVDEYNSRSKYFHDFIATSLIDYLHKSYNPSYIFNIDFVISGVSVQVWEHLLVYKATTQTMDEPKANLINEFKLSWEELAEIISNHSVNSVLDGKPTEFVDTSLTVFSKEDLAQWYQDTADFALPGQIQQIQKGLNLIDNGC